MLLNTKGPSQHHIPQRWINKINTMFYVLFDSDHTSRRNIKGLHWNGNLLSSWTASKWESLRNELPVFWVRTSVVFCSSFLSDCFYFEVAKGLRSFRIKMPVLLAETVVCSSCKYLMKWMERQPFRVSLLALAMSLLLVCLFFLVLCWFLSVCFIITNYYKAYR